MSKIKEVAKSIFKHEEVRDVAWSVGIGASAVLIVAVFFAMCTVVPGFGMFMGYVALLLLVLIGFTLLGYAIRALFNL